MIHLSQCRTDVNKICLANFSTEVFDDDQSFGVITIWKIIAHVLNGNINVKEAFKEELHDVIIWHYGMFSSTL